MGTIGRMVEEGDWAHSADLYSMWFGAIGSGYIMPTGNLCEPSITGTTEVTIASGRVCFGLPTTIDYSGEAIALDSGSEFPRYDLIYLVNNSGSVAAEVSKGSNLTLPTIPGPSTQKTVPVAVIYWDENGELAELKDVRTVMDEQHAHTDGDGLMLDSYNAEMNVDADEATMTVQNYNVEVDEVQIPSSILHEGLWLENDRVMNVDAGAGLGINQVTDSEGNVIEELLFLDPAQIAADGLTAANGNLHADLGDGIQLVSGRVTVDDAGGVILRGTTPDRQIDLYHQQYGGVYFENDRVIIQADDFDGAGLSGTNELLNVRDGYGISAGTDVNLDVGRGLSVGTQLNVKRETGGGIELDGNNKLYGEAQGIAGSGLSISSGVVNLNAGYGIAVSTDTTHMDLESGGGLQINSGQVEVNRGTGIKVGADYGRLQVDPAGIAGLGLKAASGELALDVDGGLEVSSDQVNVNSDGSITTNGGQLEVVPSQLVDDSTLIAFDGEVQLDPKPDFFELLVDEEFTLSPGEEHVITCADTMVMVSINAEGQTATNEGAYRWYFQETQNYDSDAMEVVVKSVLSNNETINLRARLYWIKWAAWME